MFLPATASSPYCTVYLPCFQNYRDKRTLASEARQGAKDLGNHQEQLMQILIVCFLKTHLFIILKIGGSGKTCLPIHLSDRTLRKDNPVLFPTEQVIPSARHVGISVDVAATIFCTHDHPGQINSITDLLVKIVRYRGWFHVTKFATVATSLLAIFIVS